MAFSWVILSIDRVVEVAHRGDDVLRRERPVAVGVREIGLPAQHVLVEPVHVLHADFVADEAGVEVPFENVGRARRSRAGNVG